MASQFKNRLVGVTIVVASVVIFLPSIIDGKKTIYEDDFIATPIKPSVKAHTLALASVALENSDSVVKESIAERATESDATDWAIEEIAEAVTAASPDVTAQEAADTKSVTIQKQATARPIETPWTIQLGAFQNAVNINQLLKKLHKAGFQAHTIPAEVIDGDLTRVFVGPDISKRKLEEQLTHLQSLTKLQGKLMPFNALSH